MFRPTAFFLLTPLTLGTLAPAADRQQALIEILTSNAPMPQKAAACRDLKLAGDHRSVPALAALLTAQELSTGARGALESMPGPEASKALRDAIAETSGVVRSGIVDSIGERRDEQAVPLLAPLLQDTDAHVVASAALALGKIGTAEAARLLGAAYTQAPEGRRVTIGDGLVRCADSLLRSGSVGDAAAIYAELAKPDTPRTVRAAALRGVLASAGPRRRTRVREFLGSDDPLVRAAGAGALPELSRGDVRDLADASAHLPAESHAALLAAVRRRTEAVPTHDERMAWWRDARFGMFIHWGVYAVPAGAYGGTQYKRIGEWIMDTARIPRSEYEKLAAEFDPRGFDADAWVRMAKYAGMKYIVITSKHHDGFCLFDAPNSTYDIVDATPYARDVLKDLSAACRRHGLRFCTYYSIMDWHHPAQLPAREEDGRPVWNPTRIAEGQKEAYTQYMKTHLRALVLEYQTQVLWFDGEWPSWWTDDDGRSLYEWLLRLNPHLIVNNRIGAGRGGMAGFTREGSFAGDFGTPEQEIPATGVDSDWESCMTMNDTWGYKSLDDNWKRSERLIRNLIDIASKGGNYLLNVGPKADGTFPQPSVERLREMGGWMAVNGESVYGSHAALFKPAWGRVTRKEGTLYLHVFDWPENGTLTIPALGNTLRRASLLARPEVTLKAEIGGDTWTVHVPETALDPFATVIALDMGGTPALAK